MRQSHRGDPLPLVTTWHFAFVVVLGPYTFEIPAIVPTFVFSLFDDFGQLFGGLAPLPFLLSVVLYCGHALFAPRWIGFFFLALSDLGSFCL